MVVLCFFAKALFLSTAKEFPFRVMVTTSPCLTSIARLRRARPLLSKKGLKVVIRARGLSRKSELFSLLGE